MEIKTIEELADKYGLVVLKSTWFDTADDYSMVAEGLEISVRAVHGKEGIIGYNGNIMYPDGTVVAVISRIPLDKMIEWLDKELNVASEEWE